MINWLSVFFNSFWVLGLAIMLAALSYTHWTSYQHNQRLRTELSEPQFLRFFWLGLFLIGIGLAGTSQRVWEIAVWVAFTALSLFSFLRLGLWTRNS